MTFCLKRTDGNTCVFCWRLQENASPATATTLPRTCFILGKCFCAGLDIFFTSKHVTFSHCKVAVKKNLNPLAFFRSYAVQPATLQAVLSNTKSCHTDRATTATAFFYFWHFLNHVFLGEPVWTVGLLSSIDTWHKTLPRNRNRIPD